MKFSMICLYKITQENKNLKTYNLELDF